MSIANIAVSVTGIAGPAGEEYGKPVGTVYFGVMTDHFDTPKTFRKNFAGNRESIRKQTTLCAIEVLISGVEAY